MSPRYQAFRATLDAVYTLAHRGVDEFRGDKVHALLVAAAREHEWWAPTAHYKAVPPPSAPFEKVCRRCKQSKPQAVFRALATPAQKQRNGWNMHGQYFVSSLLCDVCRPLRKRELIRKQAKKQAPTLVQAYRKSISNTLAALRKVLVRHSTLSPAPGLKVLEFTHAPDKAYYLERQRLLGLLRDRLDDAVHAGTIDPRTAKGEWHELLTEDERMHLRSLYNCGSWAQPGFHGTVPVLWDKRRGKVVIDVADTVERNPYKPKVEPPPEALLTARKEKLVKQIDDDIDTLFNSGYE